MVFPGIEVCINLRHRLRASDLHVYIVGLVVYQGSYYQSVQPLLGGCASQKSHCVECGPTILFATSPWAASSLPPKSCVRCSGGPLYGRQIGSFLAASTSFIPIPGGWPASGGMVEFLLRPFGERFGSPEMAILV